MRNIFIYGKCIYYALSDALHILVTGVCTFIFES